MAVAFVLVVVEEYSGLAEAPTTTYRNWERLFKLLLLLHVVVLVYCYRSSHGRLENIDV